MIPATWPPGAVRIHVDGLVLQLADDEQLGQLAELAAAGLHPEGEMPFAFPWTVGTPADRARATVQWHWQVRGSWTPQDWSFDAVVLRDGEVLGTQAVSATGFGVRGEVVTGSWLGRAHQGQGVGVRMRAAVLAFAFDTLGAREATTEAFTDNPRSAAVTRRLGYREDGVRRVARLGRPATMQRWRLAAEDFTAPWPVRVEGWSPAAAGAFGQVTAGS